MQPAISELDEVEVISNRLTYLESPWLDYLNTFKNDLFGNSENVLSCRILNPETISFSYHSEKDRLMAYASEPIKIINEAMAYEVSYYLESFERKGESLRIRGRVRFKNNYSSLSGPSKGKIKAERKRSYYGSYAHFKKALLGNRLRKEGFRIYETKSLLYEKIDNKHKSSEEDVLTFKGESWELSFKDYLLVEYVREKESLNFLMDRAYSSIIYNELTREERIHKQTSGRYHY